MKSNLAVIFDMDGVLIPSPELNWQANNQVLSKYGINVSDAEIKDYLGKNLRDQVKQLSETFGKEIDYDTFEEETKLVKKELFANMKPKEGVVNLLEELTRVKIPFAVGTSTPRALAEERLKAAGVLGYFKVFVTDEDVKRHKPAPDVFIKASQLLAVSPQNCIVIEDAPAGLAAGIAAEMKVVAVRTSFVGKEDLKAANLIVASLADLGIKQLEALISNKFA